MENIKAVSHRPGKAVLTASIEACIANSERLLDDARYVEFQMPLCTKLALSMIAQEESAKAFILFLVREDVIPWSAQLLRAMNDHACKQLVGVVIDYIEPKWDTAEDFRKLTEFEFELGERLPVSVASAINILRHEKIGRWESNNWVWDEPPEYEPAILRISKGKQDRMKQDALYVRLGRDGSVASTPYNVTETSADNEFERAGRYLSFVCALIENELGASIAYGKVRQALQMVFASST